MKTLGFVYVIGAAITWGLMYNLQQKVLEKTSPLSLLFIDSLLMVLITLPFVFLLEKPGELISGWKVNIWALIPIVILGIVANLFIFSGIKILGASTASIFEIMYPFFVVLFGFFIFKISPNIYFFIGSICIFVGSAIIVKFGS